MDVIGIQRGDGPLIPGLPHTGRFVPDKAARLRPHLKLILETPADLAPKLKG